ncbi:PREDICTED: uncharacterized protein LOC104590574 isoform X2 [Nelumbo nucifera]|uniref:Uncharacterized protein n=2 Tax=Nelumbo nucifera TaxID=4432 RepID=A0A822ZYZ6_NELNU|nr:PREDICTED: uncharacterized protein LOC104590574 isoform X2 [Nelumbo nucifera]DAD48329.1 TPA_asm: hypothetical protein HUJ06_018266 [Nelumbo nucifera]
MASASVPLCISNLSYSSRRCNPTFSKPSSVVNDKPLGLSIIFRVSKSHQNCETKKLSHRFVVLAITKDSAKSNDSEETIPSWAKPDSDVPPPWAQDEGKEIASQQSFEIPFYVYLLASTITAIAAIGSVFEYVNQKPVFGLLNSDSVFYAPLLGFFAFTGVPTSGKKSKPIW